MGWVFLLLTLSLPAAVREGRACARPTSAVELISERGENLRFYAVLGTSGSALHADQIFDVGHRQVQAIEVHHRGGIEKIFEAVGPTRCAEDVPISGVSHERDGVSGPPCLGFEQERNVF